MNLNVGWTIDELRKSDERQCLVFEAKNGIDVFIAALACNSSNNCILDAINACPFDKPCKDVDWSDWASIIHSRKNEMSMSGMKEAFGRILGTGFLEMFWKKG